jgi:rubrerythrin
MSVSNSINPENYEFDDDSFGLATACLMANDAMAKAQVNPERGPRLLQNIMEQWPEIYALGGRKRELANLINSLVSGSLIVLVILCFIGGAAADEAGIIRVRREGFGPWEAQETWDEKGKPVVADKIVSLLEEVVKVEKEVVAEVQVIFKEVQEIVEHPIRQLSKTRGGFILLIIIAIGLALLSFNVLLPILRVVSRALVWLTTTLISLIKPLFKIGVCVHLCAIYPLVWVRNKIRACEIRRKEKKRMIYVPVGGEIEMEENLISELKMDEKGLYLQEEGSRKKIYMKESDSNYLKLAAFSNGTRVQPAEINVQTVKETVLRTSKLYKIDKLPDFQGQFEVDGQLIGHFSRIRVGNRDCILTAYHVLDYNKHGVVTLTKHGRGERIRFDSIRSRILYASPTNELDFIIIEVAPVVFSTLGLKMGQWTHRAQPREPICINQLYEGKPCVSSGTMSINESKAWHVKYGASTICGSSGAPILDARGNIVGVHLEYDTMAHLNVGVIPPLFRNTKKESRVSNDIMQAENDLEEFDEELEKYYDELAREEEVYRVIAKEHVRDLALVENTMSWAEEMNAIDDYVEKKMRDREEFDFEDYAHYKTFVVRGQRGKHINEKVKGGVFRKESPWTCSKCYTVHENKGFSCTVCGFALVKGLRTPKKKQDEQLETISRIFPEVVSDKIKEHYDRDELIREITQRVVEALTKPSPSAPLYPNLVDIQTQHNLPPVKVEKSLVEKLKRRKPQDDLAIQAGISQNLSVKEGKGENTLVHSEWHLPVGKAYEEGLEKKVTEIAKVQPTKKRARRRVKKNNKETVPAVPLNSLPPARAGANTTNGSKRKNSLPTPLF